MKKSWQRRKRVLAGVVLTGGLLAAMTPGVLANDAAADDLLAQIQEKGVITFAMEGQWAPWTYHDEDGELVGYDTEVGKALAEKLGVEATFVEGE